MRLVRGEETWRFEVDDGIVVPGFGNAAYRVARVDVFYDPEVDEWSADVSGRLPGPDEFLRVLNKTAPVAAVAAEAITLAKTERLESGMCRTCRSQLL